MNSSFKRCGKIRFVTRELAKAHLKEQNHIGRNRLSKKLTNIYYCDGCSAWHTTSMKKEKSREISKTIK